MTTTTEAPGRPRPIDVLLNTPREEWTAVERWATGGVQIHDLPSGTRIAGRRRDPVDLLAAGILTEDLFAACVAVAKARQEGRPLTGDEVLASLAFVRLAATGLVSWVWDADTESWSAAELDEIAYASLDPADRRYLEAIVNGEPPA